MRKLWMFITAAFFLVPSCGRIDVPAGPVPEEPSAGEIPMVEVHVNGVLDTPDTKVILEKYKSGFKASWQQDNALFVEYSCGDCSGVSKFTWNSETGDFVGSLPDITGDWNYKAYYLGRVNRYSYSFSHYSILDYLSGMFMNTRYVGSCSYDDVYDPLYCNVDVRNSGPGVGEDGETILFPLERLTSILLFEFTSGLDEPVESATLTVTTADGTGIAVSDSYDISLEDDGTASFPSGVYQNTVTCVYDGAFKADDFAVWFSILPVEFETMTLTVTTSSHVFTTTRKSAGSYEKGFIYTVDAAIPDSRWTERFARAEVGEVLFSWGMDQEPYQFEDLGRLRLGGTMLDLSYTDNAGGTSPEAAFEVGGGLDISDFPTGMSEIMEVTFRTTDLSSLMSDVYNPEPVEGETGMYRGYCMPQNIPSAFGDLHFYNMGQSVLYLDDICIRASDHEGFLCSMPGEVGINPSMPQYYFFLNARGDVSPARISLSPELASAGFAVDAMAGSVNMVSDGVYEVDSYPSTLLLYAEKSGVHGNVSGSITFSYEENGVPCSRVCTVFEEGLKFTPIADAADNGTYNFRGRIDAGFGGNMILNDGTGARFLSSSGGYGVGDYVQVVPGQLYGSTIYTSYENVTSYVPEIPLVLTPGRLYRNIAQGVAVPYHARIAGVFRDGSIDDGYFHMLNYSDRMCYEVDEGDYVVADGYMLGAGSDGASFIETEFYLLPSVELLDADGHVMETSLACNRAAQSVSFKVRLGFDAYNSDVWTLRTVAGDSQTVRSASMIADGDGLYTVYVNVAANRSPMQRTGRITLVFSMGDGMECPFIVSVCQSADEDAVGIPGDNFRIGGWEYDFDGLGDEIRS